MHISENIGMDLYYNNNYTLFPEWLIYMLATTIFYTPPLLQNRLQSQVPSPTNHQCHNFVVVILNSCRCLPLRLVREKRRPVEHALLYARQEISALHHAPPTTMSCPWSKLRSVLGSQPWPKTATRTPCGLLRVGKDSGEAPGHIFYISVVVMGGVDLIAP